MDIPKNHKKTLNRKRLNLPIKLFDSFFTGFFDDLAAGFFFVIFVAIILNLLILFLLNFLSPLPFLPISLRNIRFRTIGKQ